MPAISDKETVLEMMGQGYELLVSLSRLYTAWLEKEGEEKIPVEWKVYWGLRQSKQIKLTCNECPALRYSI